VALLEAKGVKAYYYVRQSQVKAVDGVDLAIEKGITLGLAGESGCGKSTLVNTLMMNVKPPLHLVEGTIALDGKLISNMDRSTLKKNIWGVLVSLVPQSALNALMPTIRIGGFMRDAISHHLSVSKSAIMSMAEKRFEELNLPVEVLSMYPHELSGGMKQRAVIAISTLLNPKLLIVDEPTSALDVCCQKMVLRMLIDLRETGITESIVFVTHDIAVLNQIADWIIIMYAGKMVESAPTDDILNDPKHPYTYSLINAVVTPEPEVKKRGMTSIPGEPPNLINPPKGCRFHPRCPYITEKCVHEVPPLFERTKGRLTACHYEIGFQRGMRLNEIDYGGSAVKG
jgi:peptide/nickel transport system ATP-binding protein